MSKRRALLIATVAGALALGGCKKKPSEAPAAAAAGEEAKGGEAASQPAAGAEETKAGEAASQPAAGAEEAKAGEAASQPAEGASVARATLIGKQDRKPIGTVTFERQEDGTVTVVAEVSGLKKGKHGFHIHEKGDCSSADFKSAGGHFNPAGAKHGAPDAPEHHVGDLGNIEVAEDGAKVTHTMKGLKLNLGEGEDSIIGKAVIIHEGEDDLKSQPTGAAGPRAACGVIEKAQ